MAEEALESGIASPLAEISNGKTAQTPFGSRYNDAFIESSCMEDKDKELGEHSRRKGTSEFTPNAPSYFGWSISPRVSPALPFAGGVRSISNNAEEHG